MHITLQRHPACVFRPAAKMELDEGCAASFRRGCADAPGGYRGKQTMAALARGAGWPVAAPVRHCHRQTHRSRADPTSPIGPTYWRCAAQHTRRRSIMSRKDDETAHAAGAGARNTAATLGWRSSGSASTPTTRVWSRKVDNGESGLRQAAILGTAGRTVVFAARRQSTVYQLGEWVISRVFDHYQYP